MNTPGDAPLFEIMRRLTSLPSWTIKDDDLIAQYDSLYVEFLQNPLGRQVKDYEGCLLRIATGQRTLRDYKTWSHPPVNDIATTKEEIQRERKKRNAIKKEIGVKKLELYQMMITYLKNRDNRFPYLTQV